MALLLDTLGDALPRLSSFSLCFVPALEVAKLGTMMPPKAGN